MLPAIEKILESVVREQIIEHFAEKYLVLNEQCEFGSKHSCETAIQHVLQKWKSSLEIGENLIAVFLDFCRAFQTVDRNIQTARLWYIGNLFKMGLFVRQRTDCKNK